MRNGTLVGGGIVLTSLLAGAAIWYLQLFGYYHEASFTPGAEIRLTPIIGEAPEVILAEGMWVASVQANAAYLALLPDRVRAALAPRLSRPHHEAVRGWLADWEVAMFRRERIAHSRRIAA